MTEIANEILRLMTSSGKSLSTAESCTSGRIAAALTSVDGASAYFQGALVAYQNEVKVRLLGVSAEDIEKYDVVSRPVVIQMVKGACARFNTDYAIASTGYVGKDNPESDVWVAFGSAEEVHTLHCSLKSEDRGEKTLDAVRNALRLALDCLNKNFA